MGAGENDAEGEIGDGGDHRVAAGEAGALDFGEVGDEVGARAGKAELEAFREQRAAADCADDKQRRAALAGGEEVDRHTHDQQGEDHVAAQRGDVRHGMFEPDGADRVGGVAGLAQGEKYGLIKPACFAFERLVRDQGKAKHAEGDNAQRDGRADLAQGEADGVAEQVFGMGQFQTMVLGMENRLQLGRQRRSSSAEPAMGRCSNEILRGSGQKAISGTIIFLLKD